MKRNARNTAKHWAWSTNSLSENRKRKGFTGWKVTDRVGRVARHVAVLRCSSYTPGTTLSTVPLASKLEQRHISHSNKHRNNSVSANTGN